MIKRNNLQKLNGSKTGGSKSGMKWNTSKKGGSKKSRKGKSLNGLKGIGGKVLDSIIDTAKGTAGATAGSMASSAIHTNTVVNENVANGIALAVGTALDIFLPAKAVNARDIAQGVRIGAGKDLVTSGIRNVSQELDGMKMLNGMTALDGVDYVPEMNGEFTREENGAYRPVQRVNAPVTSAGSFGKELA